MKKSLLALTLSVALMFGVGNAVAGFGGKLNVDLESTAGPMVDTDSAFTGSLIPTWGAESHGGAISGAFSETDAKGRFLFGSGYINSAQDPADANAAAGAETNSSSYRDGFLFFGANGGVATDASAFGSTDNDLKLGMKALGYVAGDFHAITGEATAAEAGAINLGPATFGTTNVKGVQGGIGGYEANLGVIALGTAEATVNLFIAGETNVRSDRTGSIVNTQGLGKGVREGLSSAGYVATTVESNVVTDRSGFGIVCVDGGFIAAGSLELNANQVGYIHPSSANASASGSYAGSKDIGKDYQGIAQGGTATQITQYENAVVVQSSGYMSVTSK